VPYLRPDGAVGYRCPGEPVAMYVRKGGDVADTADRSCLCNALMANVGLGQTRRATGYVEDQLVTLGSDLDGVRAMLHLHPDGWSAAQAVTWLLGRSAVADAGRPCNEGGRASNPHQISRYLSSPAMRRGRPRSQDR
jgi:hypothetical protein